MPAIEPPTDKNRDRGPYLIAIFWTECAIALIAVSLRIHGRNMVRKLGPDDYMMLFTMVCDS